MPRNKPVLDPYCTRCGKYKGVGACRNIQCEGNESQDVLEVCSISICVLCSDPAEVVCSRCGRGYCETHSSHRSTNELGGLEHHIGTCNQCLKFVCERCWLLDDNGLIMCFKHLEDNYRIGTKDT